MTDLMVFQSIVLAIVVAALALIINIGTRHVWIEALLDDSYKQCPVSLEWDYSTTLASDLRLTRPMVYVLVPVWIQVYFVGWVVYKAYSIPLIAIRMHREDRAALAKARLLEEQKRIENIEAEYEQACKKLPEI